MLVVRIGKFAFTAAVAVGLAAGCKVRDPPPVTETWSDDFARDGIGPNYFDTGGSYRVIDGALSTKGSHNHPLWLRKKLPRDVRIELTAWSTTPDGDIKIELFGDGRSYDPNAGAYTSTAYVLVFGGWHNSKSLIARQDEHGKELVERRDPKVEPGRRYRFTITRKGKTLEWLIDGQPFLAYEDKSPLEGPGHEYFGFDNWESDAWFDDLVITPL
jgi:hypothetical protein